MALPIRATAPMNNHVGVNRDTVLNLTAYGSETRVPDHDICRLSYYLKCCTVGCGIMNHLSPNMIDYMNAHRLPPHQREAIVHLAFQHFNLLSLIDRAFILDDQHILLPRGTLNTFYEIETASVHFSIDPFTSVTLSGQVTRVHRVMLCNMKWMQEYYIEPFLQMRRTNPPQSQPTQQSTSSISAPINAPRNTELAANPSSHSVTSFNSNQDRASAHFHDNDGINEDEDYNDEEDDGYLDGYDDDDFDEGSVLSLPPVVAMLVSPGGESSLSRNAGCLVATQHESTTCQHCNQHVFRRAGCIGFYRCTRCPDYTLCDQCFSGTTSLSRSHNFRHPFECVANPEHLRSLRMRSFPSNGQDRSYSGTDGRGENSDENDDFGSDNNGAHRENNRSRFGSNRNQLRRHRSGRHSRQMMRRSTNGNGDSSSTSNDILEETPPMATTLPDQSNLPPALNEDIPVAIAIPMEDICSDDEDNYVYAPAIMEKIAGEEVVEGDSVGED